MLASMTAFGRAANDGIDWQIRSVNHRYLDISFRLPEGFRDLEPELRDLTTARVGRGKVDASLHVAAGRRPPRVETSVIVRLLSTVQALRELVPEMEMAPADPVGMVRFPGALAEPPVDDDLRKATTDGFVAALDSLGEHRKAQGTRLAFVIDDRILEAKRLVQELRTMADGQRPKMLERLRGRVNAIAENVVDPKRLEQELVMLVQKADVAEELDRLTIHLDEAAGSIDGAEPCGRRLDFLMQELSREANTLGAKSTLPEASSMAVELKVVIEQIREQVQNVE